MIYLDMKFRSEALSGNAQLSLLLPDGAESFKTLWLLHGLYGDHTSWMRNSSIERYAAQYGIAVVMKTNTAEIERLNSLLLYGISVSALDKRSRIIYT